MKIYRVIHNSRVEAHSAEEASYLHMENNSVCQEEFFLDEQAALARFAQIEENLNRPSALGKGLYWFDCVSKDESSDDCDEPEDGSQDSLRDSYYSAFLGGQYAEVAVGSTGCWYAIQKDQDDTDWGTGSYDLEEATEKALRSHCTRIAVIDESGDGECVEEIDLLPRYSYRIKPECSVDWFNGCEFTDADLEVTFDEVCDMAADWGTDIYGLLDQLEMDYEV